MYEKSLEVRHFRVSPYPEEPELAPCWAAGVARDGKMRETAPTEAVGCTIEGGREAKNGNPCLKSNPGLKPATDPTLRRGSRGLLLIGLPRRDC